MIDPVKRDVIRWLRAEIARATARQSEVDLEALDLKRLRELQRLVRDFETERASGVRPARMEPWRG